MENPLFVPNSTQVPNIVFDLINQIPDPEWKLLMYIVRRTYGFQKDYDEISLSQFKEGIMTKAGKRIDFGTGLSKPTIINALKNLQIAGLLMISKKNKINRYKINLETKLDKAIAYIAQSRAMNRKEVADHFRQMRLL